MKMRKMSVWLMLAALSVALLLSGCGQQDATEMVYHVYFGLNDADTGEQEVTLDDASAYFRGEMESYGYGYTVHRTYGA